MQKVLSQGADSIVSEAGPETGRAPRGGARVDADAREQAAATRRCRSLLSGILADARQGAGDYVVRYDVGRGAE